MLIKKIGLVKDYIQVRRKNGELSFGGDQTFFRVPESSEIEQRKKEYGCGVVAFADLLLYLGGKDNCFLTEENRSYVNRELSETVYKEYFNRIYDYIGGIV